MSKHDAVNCAKVQFSTSLKRMKMPDVLMYCIYSLPSTSRSSDLGNAATEEEQVGLLYFCDFFWLLLQFCADPREGSKGHRFRTFAIRELLSCHINCDPPTHGQLGSTLDGPWSTRKGGMSTMTFFSRKT